MPLRLRCPLVPVPTAAPQGVWVPPRAPPGLQVLGSPLSQDHEEALRDPPPSLCALTSPTQLSWWVSSLEGNAVGSGSAALRVQSNVCECIFRLFSGSCAETWAGHWPGEWAKQPKTPREPAMEPAGKGGPLRERDRCVVHIHQQQASLTCRETDPVEILPGGGSSLKAGAVRSEGCLLCLQGSPAHQPRLGQQQRWDSGCRHRCAQLPLRKWGTSL